MKKRNGKKDCRESWSLLTHMTASGQNVPVYVAKESKDSKLSPVEFRENGTQRKQPVPVGPRCAATYVSARVTCPNSCVLKNSGCYVQTGYTGRLMRRLDAAFNRERRSVGELEAAAIVYAFRRGVPQDGAHGGRDLRLHVGGDVKNEHAARILAAAAAAFKQLGGGDVWTYTRRWREVRRDAWGPIEVTASLDRMSERSAALRRGYRRVALVTTKLAGRRSRWLNGVWVTPCGHDAHGLTCVACRRCLTQSRSDDVILFAVHGAHRHVARSRVEDADRSTSAAL